MILITQYPNVSDPARQAEYAECLVTNFNNPYFSRVKLLQEEGTRIPAFSTAGGNLWAEMISGRLTFAAAINAASRVGYHICCVSNADIIFNSTLQYITHETLKGRVICLSRDDQTNRMFEGQIAGAVSQDAWIFEAPLRHTEKMWLDFEMGRPGCDNRFAYELKKAGYELVNPSLLIHARHVHKSEHRTWDESQRIPRPYEFVPVTGAL